MSTPVKPEKIKVLRVYKTHNNEKRIRCSPCRLSWQVNDARIALTHAKLHHSDHKDVRVPEPFEFEESNEY